MDLVTRGGDPFPTFRAAGRWLLRPHTPQFVPPYERLFPWLGSTAGLVLAGLILRDFPWAERFIATPPEEIARDARVATAIVLVMIAVSLLGLGWQIAEVQRARTDNTAQARFQRERAATKRRANDMVLQTVADDA